MRSIFAVAVLFLSAVVALAADPSGKYRVTGSNPGDKSEYRGTVQVDKTGDTYRVVWVVGDTRYVGTGIGSDEFFAVAYMSSDGNGIAFYGANGGNWTGVWTTIGAREIGTENWERR